MHRNSAKSHVYECARIETTDVDKAFFTTIALLSSARIEIGEYVIVTENQAYRIPKESVSESR